MLSLPNDRAYAITEEIEALQTLLEAQKILGNHLEWLQIKEQILSLQLTIHLIRRDQ